MNFLSFSSNILWFFSQFSWIYRWLFICRYSIKRLLSFMKKWQFSIFSNFLIILSEFSQLFLQFFIFLWIFFGIFSEISWIFPFFMIFKLKDLWVSLIKVFSNISPIFSKFSSFYSDYFQIIFWFSCLILFTKFCTEDLFHTFFFIEITSPRTCRNFFEPNSEKLCFLVFFSIFVLFF